MTFQQKKRIYWSANLKAVKNNGHTPVGFDLAHQRAWALRCLAMAGPIGKLP